MDIIKQCAAQPNIRARALLRSRALSERQIDHFLILACARLIRTYIMHRHEQGTTLFQIPDIDRLPLGINIPTLAARVNLDAAFTARVISVLAPDVIARLHGTLGDDHSLLTLFDNHNAA